MGAGGKMEASKVKVTDITEYGELFCKNDQKRRLKEAKIDKLKVVFF
jgi:tRNA A37 threonylcarbamoyladenosine dehydratase